MNVHGNFGLLLTCASAVPTSADVAMHGGVLDDAVARAHPLADRSAELLLFGVGDLQSLTCCARLTAPPICPSCRPASAGAGAARLTSNSQRHQLLVFMMV